MARRFNNNDQFIYKIITLGNAGVGKSTLITTYTHGACEEGLYASDFPKTYKTILCEGRTVHLDIWDTAGQERFDSITSNYYRDAHGCLLCFDISDDQSYKDLDSWRARFVDYCRSETTQTILVGTKSDLRHSGSRLSLRSKSDGELLATNLGIKYMEVSRKSQDSVNHLFTELIKMIESDHKSDLRESIKLHSPKQPEEKTRLSLWKEKITSCQC